jgi:predicted acetylornithine/succinylornithine family transaminase
MAHRAGDPVLNEDALLGVYKPAAPLFEGGEGSWLIDEDGRRFLDFTSGIAVTSLGHGAPEIREAALAALETGLLHTSNLYRTRPPRELAMALTAKTGLDRVFFCNSGGEAVEAALKFSRRWAGKEEGARGRGFVALRGSFHGRLFGSLALTDRPAYREPFEPLMPGAHFVDPDDLEAMDRALDPEAVCALILEPIQGEGGVRPLPAAFLRQVREWTRERGLLLIFDEIQCGLGRTGYFTAHEQAGVRPDLLTLAKPLAGGLPMGAVVMTEAVAGAMQPGDHGTTFGGGPFVASVALAVVRRLGDPDFLVDVRAKGARLRQGLETLRARHPRRIREIRGEGLILGVEVSGEAAPVLEAALDRELLLVGAGPKTVRLLPPLTVNDEEIDLGLERFAGALLDTEDSHG